MLNTRCSTLLVLVSYFLIFVSDWGSIGELVPHGIAEDLEHAATQAIHAGSDMDMESSAYVTHLSALVESGEVDEALIDDAVRRILRVKFLLGLFEDPYRYSDSERESRLVSADEHHELARVAARQSAATTGSRLRSP
jgi:beta-glucosidase